MESRISIIVPVYNAASTLERCVRALMGQTYRNIEIILVNDGSKDNSLELCRAFAAEDERIRVIDKPNGGVSSARNAGLDAATGEFIMFCDSDDWTEPDWCEQMLMLYTPGTLPMCGYYCHYGDGSQRIVSCAKDQTCMDKEDFFLAAKYGAYVPWNKLYELSVIRMRGLQFTVKLTLGEDQLFVWQYLQAIEGGILLTERPLNHYLWPEKASLTLNLPPNYFEQCRYLFREIFSDIQNGAPCSDDALQIFLSRIYWQFERSIKRIFENKELTELQKLRQAGAVLRCPEYRQIISHADIRQHPVVRYASRCKNSLPLYILFLLHKY